jgi:hypothetical protein
MPENTLYYGDNLDILRRYVRDETVELIYSDPPSTRTQPGTGAWSTPRPSLPWAAGVASPRPTQR